MSVSIHQPFVPVVRVRLNHAHTLKDGWRCADTTIEMTVEVPDEEAGKAIFPMLSGLLSNAYAAGKAEADERNWKDGR